MKYGTVSKFRICHTFPFGSVIILGLLLEIDIVVKACGLKYAMLPNPLLGKCSKQPYYKNGSCVSTVLNRENGSGYRSERCCGVKPVDAEVNEWICAISPSVGLIF
jgi:hypothetical protein